MALALLTPKRLKELASDDFILEVPRGGSINFSKMVREAEDLIKEDTPKAVAIIAGVWNIVEEAKILGKDVIEFANQAHRSADDVLTRLEEDFEIIKNDSNNIDKEIKKDIQFIEDNYILFLIGIGILSIIHVILFWACQRLSFSIYFGWFITLTTGGLGFFFLVYKAAVYDEDSKMEEMISRDRYTFEKNDYLYDLN